jgi:hypothetical protein
MARPPPKNPFISGVRNVNGWRTFTVIVLPGPAPPVAAVQAMDEPTAFAHDEVTVRTPAPRCAWVFVSSSTRAVIPTVSVGDPCPKLAPSRAALLIWMYEKNRRPKSIEMTTRNKKTGSTRANSTSAWARVRRRRRARTDARGGWSERAWRTGACGSSDIVWVPGGYPADAGRSWPG